MKNYAYPAIVKKSRDGTYDVQFVNFKEGFTYSNTLETRSIGAVSIYQHRKSIDTDPIDSLVATIGELIPHRAESQPSFQV